MSKSFVTLVAVAVACCARSAEPLGAQQHRDSIQRRSVTYRSGHVTIAATLLNPGLTPPVAAVVLIHGSGSSARDNPWTTAYADAFAKRGIAVLYPDKRGSGESSGDWRTSSIQDLAADVKAGINFLRRQPGIDAAGIGIVGFSQGGYVASVVAAEDTSVRFAAIISGGTASLRDQIVDELLIEAERRNQPLGESAIERLREVYGRLFGAAGGREGWEAYTRAVADAKKQGGPLAYALRTIPLDSTHWAVRYLASMGDFDPMSYWDRVSKPAVFVYGGADSQIRIDASIGRLRESPAQNHFSTIMLGSNGHALFREDVIGFLVEWFRMRGTDK